MEILATRLARQLSDKELVALLIDNLPRVINNPAQIALIDSVKAELRRLIPQGVEVENPYKFVSSLAPPSRDGTSYGFTKTLLHALGLKGTPLSIKALHEGLRIYVKHGDKDHNELSFIIDFWLLGEAGNEETAHAILAYLKAGIHDSFENPFEAAIALGKLLTRGKIKDPMVIDAVINELQGMIDRTTLVDGIPANDNGFFPRHLTTFRLVIEIFKAALPKGAVSLSQATPPQEPSPPSFIAGQLEDPSPAILRAARDGLVGYEPRFITRSSGSSYVLKLSLPTGKWCPVSPLPSTSREQIELRASTLANLYEQLCRLKEQKQRELDIEYTELANAERELLLLIERDEPKYFKEPPNLVAASRLVRSLSEDDLLRGLILATRSHSPEMQRELMAFLDPAMKSATPRDLVQELSTEPYKRLEVWLAEFTKENSGPSFVRPHSDSVRVWVNALGIKGTNRTLAAMAKGLEVYYGTLGPRTTMDNAKFSPLGSTFFMGEVGNEQCARTLLDFLKFVIEYSKVHDGRVGISLERDYDAVIALAKILRRGEIKDPQLLDDIIAQLEILPSVKEPAPDIFRLERKMSPDETPKRYKNRYYPRHITVFQLVLKMFKDRRAQMPDRPSISEPRRLPPGFDPNTFYTLPFFGVLGDLLRPIGERIARAARAVFGGTETPMTEPLNFARGGQNLTEQTTAAPVEKEPAGENSELVKPDLKTDPEKQVGGLATNWRKYSGLRDRLKMLDEARDKGDKSEKTRTEWANVLEELEAAGSGLVNELPVITKEQLKKEGFLYRGTLLRRMRLTSLETDGTAVIEDMFAGIKNRRSNYSAHFTQEGEPELAFDITLHGNFYDIVKDRPDAVLVEVPLTLSVLAAIEIDVLNGTLRIPADVLRNTTGIKLYRVKSENHR